MADLYPAVTVTDQKENAAVWTVCLVHGFTYDDGGEDVGLDPELLTFDGNGDPELSSIEEANWPAGEAANMRTFYRQWLNALIKQIFGLGANRAQLAGNKTPTELEDSF
jgi:hypothetical protein